ncbi:PA14 domain-containing protein, partial [Flavobacterium sp. ACN6]|uniref:PA14 domain-containing protein n=1 Tax=Flavobacterium sp. ACN6 TaxID=1920426 RepID=UPI001C0F1DB6
MKKTLLLFLFLPFLGFAQLNGDYIISSAHSDPNFRTLAAAVARLNNVGVSGPVKFLLDENQTITSLLSINQINTTATNSVIIKPNAGKNITINANMPDASNGVPAVFRFNGTSNITIDGSNSTLNTKNLTLVNNDNLNYTARAIIWIASNGATGSSNITVKNSNFRFSTRNQQLTLLSGVYSGGNGIGGNTSISVQENTGANSNISIINNEMFNVKDGVNINGVNSANSPTGWKIQGNKIGSTVVAEKPVRAIYLSNALNYEVSGNTLSGIRNTENQGNDGAAIVLIGTSYGTISGNYINDIVNNVHNNSYFTAGIVSRSSGVNTIANNIISNVYNTTTDSNNGNFYNKGNNIHIASGSTTNIYYNTIIGSGAPTGTAYASCLYISGGSGINIRNNIFVNTQTNKQYAVFNNGGTLGQISNNDYYVTNASNNFQNRINGTEYSATTAGTVPASWNTAVSDSNSRIILPAFTSDYHLQDVTANANLIGVAIPAVTTDIDGETRVKPYMGADEVLPCAPTGDQTSFGTESWIGYVYKWTGNTAPNPINPSTLPDTSIATYIGTVTENKTFDRNMGANAISGVTTIIPCEAAPTNKFLVRYKMRTTIAEAGNYYMVLAGDDGIRLYIDNQSVITRWNDHGYTTDVASKYLTAGSHEFVIEYYENGGDARATFSFDLTKGDPTVYGDKVWNVYGYLKNDITLETAVYAGYYVEPNLNINSRDYWNTAASPSTATNWQGAAIPNDNFTVSYKRQGFPCGQYQIQRAHYDDAIQIYIDGVLKFERSGWDNNPALINNGDLYTLNSSSKVEVRLREDGGNANVGINFLKVLTPYNGTGTVNPNTAIQINSNTTLSSDITVCSCTVNPTYTLTVPKGVTLTVDEDINVGTGGKLLVQSGGSLLQTTTSQTMFTGNSTAFEIQRTTSVRLFDLTYYSMPVTKPGFTMHDLSPNTLWDKYQYYDSDAGKWTIDYYGKMVMET